MVTGTIRRPADASVRRRGRRGRAGRAANLFVPLVELVNDTLDSYGRRPDGVVGIAVELGIGIPPIPVVLRFVLLSCLLCVGLFVSF